MNKDRLAALKYLSSAFEDFSIPIRCAELWARAIDLPEIVDGIEERVRSLSDFIANYMKEHPGILRTTNDSEDAEVIEVQLAAARKQLALVEQLRIARKRQESPDFSAEAEELRQLRSSELKIQSPRATGRAKP